jgi:carbonic anhydrase
MSKDPKIGKALVLSCMDLRVHDEMAVHLQEQQRLRDEYDHVILAGASLGATTKAKPHWNQTFWDHLELAQKLHKIDEVHLFEHQDCGAYALLLPERAAELSDPRKEEAVHKEVSAELAAEIERRFPGLTVKAFYVEIVEGTATGIVREFRE